MRGVSVDKELQTMHKKRQDTPNSPTSCVWDKLFAGAEAQEKQSATKMESLSLLEAEEYGVEVGSGSDRKGREAEADLEQCVVDFTCAWAVCGKRGQLSSKASECCILLIGSLLPSHPL